MSRSAESSRAFSAVARALLLYLVVAWLLVRYVAAGKAGLTLSPLLSLAILAGFPIAALVAVRLAARETQSRSDATWGMAGLAVLAAVALPITCIERPVEVAPPAEIVLTPAAAGPAVLAGAKLAGAEEGLRLRIRGLSVLDGAATGPVPGGEAAEILLVTSVHPGPVADELVVSVQLVSAEGGVVIWREEYRGDPQDLTAVRRLLIRALTEAMSLTREGVSGGQIV